MGGKTGSPHGHLPVRNTRNFACVNLRTITYNITVTCNLRHFIESAKFCNTRNFTCVNLRTRNEM